MNRIKRKGLKIGRFIVFSFAIIFLILFFLSFTNLPYWGIYNLATTESDFDFKPDLIVIMGGSGVPSQTALMRTYHAATLAKAYPKSKIIIALPGELSDSSGHLQKMKHELRIRSVNNFILYEPQGTNTRSQALKIKQLVKNNTQLNTVIVSSPEHIYRTIKTFKKLGFQNIGGYPAFEKDLKLSLKFNSKELGGTKLLPNIGNNTQLRYQFWNHLIYEIRIIREWVAISYYKLEGWI